MVVRPDRRCRNLKSFLGRLDSTDVNSHFLRESGLSVLEVKLNSIIRIGTTNSALRNFYSFPQTRRCYLGCMRRKKGMERGSNRALSCRLPSGAAARKVSSRNAFPDLCDRRSHIVMVTAALSQSDTIRVLSPGDLVFPGGCSEGRDDSARDTSCTWCENEPSAATA